MRSLVLLSGGVDSTVLAYHLADKGHRLHCVSFAYGQRHGTREIAAAQRTAAKLHAHHSTVPLAIFGTNALTGHGEIPSASTSNVEATKPVVVPGRNLVFLSVAGALAAGSGVREVYFAAHAGDAASFVDCRVAFVGVMETAYKNGGLDCCVVAPFIYTSKADIVRRGGELGVPWTDAYSCYVGGVQHCGKCGACIGRLEAFAEAGVDDAPIHKYPPSPTVFKPGS